ncbi:glycosyltransferase family 2 protein [Herminiimonas sp. CN]|uniref:glycosyltransferase family 2 protein n=1 Tax=Herminiimonas sp. CN TaxID=1349818 RepID=UPI0009DD50AA|nr:glycosyltransferase [Herminiimonas sp. CN]
MISVVIVNYNLGAFIAECIHSVPPQVQEVIIIDNASTDNSMALVRTAFSEVSN